MKKVFNDMLSSFLYALISVATFIWAYSSRSGVDVSPLWAYFFRFTIIFGVLSFICFIFCMSVPALRRRLESRE